MTQDSFDLLQLWIKAIENELVTPLQWQDWADREIERSAEPSSWICDFATSTKETVLAKLYQAMPGSSSTLRSLDGLMLSLGVLYSRCQSGQIALDQLLLQAGDLADRANASRPSCEDYYALVTELERGQHPGKEIESKVHALFEQPLRYAKRELRRISVDL